MNPIMDFWSSVLKTQDKTKPVWNIPHEDVLENKIFILKQFRVGTSGYARFVDPPMAGHHSNICERVIDLYLKTTSDSVYAIEYKAATQETKNYGIIEIINCIDRSINWIYENDSKNIHMAGLCQGGWSNVIYAVLYPHMVISLIIAGTPIDFIIDGGKIQKGLEITTDAFIENVISTNNGVWPGEAQLLGFKMLNPYDRYIGIYVDLYIHTLFQNKKMVEKWERNEKWYEYAQDLPGKFIKEVSKMLFRENALINKKLKINKVVVDLSKIKCPIVAITGDDDDITLERQCTSIFDYVSSKDTKHYAVAKCGHIGIFLKNESLKFWNDATKFIDKSLGL